MRSRPAESRGPRTKAKKPPAGEMASTMQQMSILIKAGVPLVESLTGLADQARAPALKECLGRVAEEVSQGTALSDAFARHPSIFPSLAVEMTKIAEAGGNLSDAMGRLAEHMESSAEISRKVKSALAYPIVVVCISLLTVVTMVTFILPRFMSAFRPDGREAPVDHQGPHVLQRRAYSPVVPVRCWRRGGLLHVEKLRAKHGR